MTLWAAAPILLTIALIAVRRSALVSATAGLASAVAIAWWQFPIASSSWPALVAEWLPVLLEVLLIIAGGLLLSEASRASGRQERIAAWLQRTLGSGVGAALAIVHGVTPFAESVTGFGIGLTVAIPLLLHLGFTSRRAAIIGLIGLCAVPWGSMGPGTLIAASLSGIDLTVLGVASGVASGPVFLIVGVVTAWLTSSRGGRVPALTAGLASGTVLWGAVTGANALIGTPPAGAVGALVTLLVHLAFHRIRGRAIGMTRQEALALTGYAVLLGGVLAATAVLLASGLTESPWHYAASPALWLFIAVAATTPPSLARHVTRTSASQWWHAGPATGIFVLLGVVMASSGMSEAIALAVASVGAGYAVLLPYVGALGGYLTGSNSAANAMFAAPQAQIIGALGLPPLAAMAAHNVASSFLIVASPARIELAAQLSWDPAEGRRAGRVVLGVSAAIVTVIAAGLGLLALA